MSIAEKIFVVDWRNIVQAREHVLPVTHLILAQTDLPTRFVKRGAVLWYTPWSVPFPNPFNWTPETYQPSELRPWKSSDEMCGKREVDRVAYFAKPAGNKRGHGKPRPGCPAWFAIEVGDLVGAALLTDPRI